MIRWEYQSDSVFKPCSSEVSQTLEKAATSGKARCSFKNSIYMYIADITPMTQTNTSTGKTRAIRRVPPFPCCVRTATDQWYWQDDNGELNLFAPHISQILEIAAQAGQRTCDYDLGKYNASKHLAR